MLCCKGRLTEADTRSIRLGTTQSGLTSAHLHHPPNSSVHIQVMTATGRKWYNKNATYGSVTECSVHHAGLYIYKNVQYKHYDTAACDAIQEKTLKSDSSSHTDHFTDCQCEKLYPAPVRCFYSSHTWDLIRSSPWRCPNRLTAKLGLSVRPSIHKDFTARCSYATTVLGVLNLILSVRPSVCLSHACFVTNPKNLPAIFLYHIKGKSF